MNTALELRLQLPYREARALSTLCARLTSERARQIADGDAEMQDALDAVQRLHWDLVAVLAGTAHAGG